MSTENENSPLYGVENDNYCRTRIRRDALEEAARLIETKAVGYVNNKPGHIFDREDGDKNGIGYAAAIRSLADQHCVQPTIGECVAASTAAGHLWRDAHPAPVVNDGAVMKARVPDHLYDPDNGEYTVVWEDRNDSDIIGIGDGAVKRFAVLFEEDRWAARLPVKWEDGFSVEYETKWFATEAEARAALTTTLAATKPEGEGA